LVARIIVAIKAEVGSCGRAGTGLWRGILDESGCERSGHQDTCDLFQSHMLVLAQMGFIPKDAKWYLADIVEEIRVQGNRRNVVHTNLILVRADSADEEYKDAIALGKREIRSTEILKERR